MPKPVLVKYPFNFFSLLRLHKKYRISCCGRVASLLVAIFFFVQSRAQMHQQQDLAAISADDRVSYLFINFLTTSQPYRLDSIKAVAEKLNDNRLSDYIMLFENTAPANNKPYQEQTKIYKAAGEKAEVSSFDDVRGTFYFLKGMNAFYHKDYTTALPVLFLSHKLLEKAGYRSYAHFCYYYYGFFAMYYYFEDYQDAAENCKLAIENSGRYPLADPKTYYDNMGECYVKLKKYELAKGAFLAGIGEAEKANDPNFKALITGNLGNLLRIQGQYKESLPYLYNEASTNEKVIPENAALSRIYIANALLHLDSVDKSSSYLQPPSFSLPSWVFPEYDIIRLQTWALYYEKTGNYRVAGNYKDSLLVLKDSLRTVFDFKKLSTLESNVQAEKYMTDRNDLEMRARNERFTRNVVIAVLVIIFTGLFLWLGYRRKAEKELETQKLAQANTQLEQYIRHIKDKNDLIEKMSSQLQEVNEVSASAGTAAYLKDLQGSVILTEADWQEFKKLYEQAFPGFLQNLAKQYPGLTPAEERLLALEQLQLPTKDMANMLGISADSIKKSRYRLRKKFPDGSASLPPA